jgi:hypothetical protein
MPETFGKRQRKATQERKAVVREERRVARNQRREARLAGLPEPSEPTEVSTDEDDSAKT